MPLRTTRDVPLAADAGQATEGTAPAVSGAAAIARYLKGLPGSPGVYRMIDAAGDVLYVGKARSLKKRVTNYAQGRFHTNRIGRMVRDTATMEFVVDRAPRPRRCCSKPILSSACGRASTCCCATTSRSPISCSPATTPSPQHLQASRRAQAQGRLFRPVRLGRRRRPHHQFAAARLPAPHLHRLGLREPHAALPALPDQALLRALHRRDRRERLRRAGRRGEGFPVRRSQKVKTEISGADAAGGREPRFRARRQSIATGWRRCRTCRAIRASIRRASRRPTCSPSIRRAARPASRCSSSAPARTGATAPISRRPTRPRGRGGAGRLPRAVLRRQAGAAADPAVARRRGAGTAGRGAVDQGRAQGRRSRCRSAARRTDLVDHAAAECARGAGPQAGRDVDAGTAARRACARPSAWPSRRAASRSTTTPTSWAPMRSAP